MAGPQISFTRTEKYSDHVAEELKQIIQDQDFTDFKLIVNEEELPCHKLTLAIHSPLIKTMLKSDMAEVAKQSYRLDHIPLEIVQKILKYMYFEDFSIAADQLMDLLKASDFLQMRLLKEMCICQVPAILKPDNVISWLQLGTKLKIADITSKCSEIMVSNFTAVTNQQEFLAMSSSEVKDYFTDVIKASTERDHILYAAIRWANHDAANRLEDLENFLHQVQLDNCSQDAIVDIMDMYGTTIVSNMNVYKLLTTVMKQKQKQRKPEPRPLMKPMQLMKSMLTIVGGQMNEKVSPVCWNISPQKEFEELCKIPHKLAKRHSACKCPQGFAITGGEESDLCITFNASSKSWSKLQNMVTKRYAHGSICTKNVLFVFGGRVNYKKSTSVDYLLLDGGNWQHGVDLPLPVYWAKVADINDNVYLLDAQETKQLLQLDPGKKMWNKQAPLPGNGDSKGVSMVAVNNRLYVAGGEERICAWYTPETNTWCTGQQPCEKHKYGSLVHNNNTLMLLGGSYYQGTDKVEELNLGDGSCWSISNIKMPTCLEFHYALLLDVPQQE